MQSSLRLACVLAFVCTASGAIAATPLNVTVENITADMPIPSNYALCKPTVDGKSGPGDNIRPTISWKGAPVATQSYAIIVSDLDVPADFSQADKDGLTIDATAPRQPFYHWALIDIPVTIGSIPGAKADVAPANGVALPNDLGSYVPDNHQYGGPCPPWNDARVHHYHFAVYALDVKTLGLKPSATAKDAARAITQGGHIVGQGEVVGTYTLNKGLRK